MAWGGHGHPWGQVAYHYPDQLELFVKAATDKNQWTNVYFCPHLLLDSKSKKRENAGPVKALWLDKDAGTKEEINPRPTMCWRTSEGKHHALWLLDECVEPEKAEEVCRYLTYSIPGADKNCWNLGRVIRLPNTLNYKYHPPAQGELLWDDGPVYKIEDLEPKGKGEIEKALEESSKEKPPKLPKEVPSLTEALISYGPRIPSEAWALLSGASGDVNDRSSTLWKMERLLLEAGVPAKHTFAIVRESPWNKYKQDKRTDENLWSDVHKASLAQGPYQDSPDELAWLTMDELLLYSERPEWLVQGIWMEKNVGWIAGVGKSYKSMLSLDLALSVASGTPFLGKYKVNNPGPVMMVQEEDPRWRVSHRAQVISHQKGISHLELTENGRSLTLEIKGSKVPIYVSVGGEVLFKNSNRIEALEKAIDRIRPRMLVLDPFNVMAAGYDEFKSGEILEVLNILKHWRNKYDCAIVVLHHYRKAQGTAVERLYGAQALYSWSENNLYVSREETRNTAIIDRDIKDAERENTKIAVDFRDIQESYDFLVREYTPEETAGRKGSADKITAFLKHLPAGQHVSKQELAEGAGCDVKTIERRLPELEKTSKVTIHSGGRGGKVTVAPLPGLWGDDSEEMEVMI